MTQGLVPIVPRKCPDKWPPLPNTFLEIGFGAKHKLWAGDCMNMVASTQNYPAKFSGQPLEELHGLLWSHSDSSFNSVTCHL